METQNNRLSHFDEGRWGVGWPERERKEGEKRWWLDLLRWEIIRDLMWSIRSRVRLFWRVLEPDMVSTVSWSRTYRMKQFEMASERDRIIDNLDYLCMEAEGVVQYTAIYNPTTPQTHSLTKLRFDLKYAERVPKFLKSYPKKGLFHTSSHPFVCWAVF